MKYTSMAGVFEYWFCFVKSSYECESGGLEDGKSLFP